MHSSKYSKIKDLSFSPLLSSHTHLINTDQLVMFSYVVSRFACVSAVVTQTQQALNMMKQPHGQAQAMVQFSATVFLHSDPITVRVLCSAFLGRRAVSYSLIHSQNLLNPSQGCWSKPTILLGKDRVHPERVASLLHGQDANMHTKACEP